MVACQTWLIHICLLNCCSDRCLCARVCSVVNWLCISYFFWSFTLAGRWIIFLTTTTVRISLSNRWACVEWTKIRHSNSVFGRPAASMSHILIWTTILRNILSHNIWIKAFTDCFLANFRLFLKLIDKHLLLLLLTCKHVRVCFLSHLDELLVVSLNLGYHRSGLLHVHHHELRCSRVQRHSSLATMSHQTRDNIRDLLRIYLLHGHIVDW